MLLLGNCSGRAASEGERIDLISEQSVLQDQIAAMALQRDEALEAAHESEVALRAADESVRDLEIRLSDSQALVAGLEDERDAALVAIADLEARVAELETERDALASRPAPLLSAPSSSSSGSNSSGSSSGSTSGGSVYYANCSAARAAGAAPVRTGDPGYGTHLDRDRDGVGCE